jgi:uncharacterized protein (DUF736 family)
MSEQVKNPNRIGACWKKVADTGTYLSGQIEINGEKININIYTNKFKEKETQPDFVIYKQKPKQTVKPNPELGEVPQEEVPW